MSKCVLYSPHADTQTDTKVNTEDTLSGFQEFFLQPINKDRSNIGLNHLLSWPVLGLEPEFFTGKIHVLYVLIGQWKM